MSVLCECVVVKVNRFLLLHQSGATDRRIACRCIMRDWLPCGAPSSIREQYNFLEHCKAHSSVYNLFVLFRWTFMHFIIKSYYADFDSNCNILHGPSYIPTASSVHNYILVAALAATLLAYLVYKHLRLTSWTDHTTGRVKIVARHRE